MERRRICIQSVREGGVANAVAALAEAQGHEVVRGEAAGHDLLVLEAEDPPRIPLSPHGVPILVVVRRRLRDSEMRAFEAAGATRVIDADASLLDVAFAFSDLLFSTLSQHRRYSRRHGGLSCRFRPLGVATGASREGSLVGIARSGAYVVTREPAPEGAPIQMEIDFGGRAVPVRGRVAFVARGPVEPWFGVEFALDDHEVAPRLSEL